MGDDGVVMEGGRKKINRGQEVLFLMYFQINNIGLTMIVDDFFPHIVWTFYAAVQSVHLE